MANSSKNDLLDFRLDKTTSGPALEKLRLAYEELEQNSAEQVQQFKDFAGTSGPALEKLRLAHEELEGSVAEQAQRFREVAAAYQGESLFSPFHRRLLTTSEVDALVSFSNELGCPMTSAEIRYLGRRFRAVEVVCVGRTAATASEGIFRFICCLGLRRETLRLLEIGALFGLGSGFIASELQIRGTRVDATLVDFFQGYYESDTDPYTGLPIRKEIIERNMQQLGLSPNTFRLVPGDSTSDSVLQVVSDRTYDVIVIDGDHSRLGLIADLKNAAQLVADGGFVVVDDDRNPDWPDVEQVIDEVESAPTDLVVVYRILGSAVLAKTKALD